MNKFFVALLLATSTAAVSCGRPGSNLKNKQATSNTSTLTFTVEQKPSTFAWAGHAQQFMIYLVGTSGNNFAASVPIILAANTTTATAQLIVPNGYYHGYALAWDSSNLSGNVGCWKDLNANLAAGGDQTVNLDIYGTAATCDYNSAAGPFGPPGFASTSNFSALTIRACNATSLSAGSSCSPGTATSTYYSGSVRVVLEQYVQPPGSAQSISGSGLQGSCQTLSTGIATGTVIVPVGSNNANLDRFISTTLQFFPAAGCSGNPGKVIKFPFGLVNGSPDGASAISTGNSIAVDVGS